MSTSDRSEGPDTLATARDAGRRAGLAAPPMTAAQQGRLRVLLGLTRRH